MFKFNGKTPKKILCRGLNVAELLVNNVTVWISKTLAIVTGYPITLIDSVGDDLEDYKIYGNSVQDNEPTPDNPVEIQYLGELVTDEEDENYGKYKITVKVNNKNLLNCNIKFGYYNSNEGKIVLENSKLYTSTEVFKLPKGEYILSSKNDIVIIRYYNKTEQKNNILGAISLPYTFKLDTESEIAFSFRKKDKSEWDLGDNTIKACLQIEKGTEKTEYLEHEENIKNIYLDKPLKKIGDYSDYIDYANQKIIRQIETFNAADLVEWRMPLHDENNAVFTNLSSTTMCDFKLIDKFFLCTHLKCNAPAGGYQAALNKGVGLYAWKSGTYKYLYFVVPLEIASSVEMWKNFINKENLKVVYIKNEEEEEKIELPQIQTFQKTNNIVVETEIQPSNMEVEYYKFNN